MLSPWMLLGLAGLGVPIILHLIQRQRMRPEPLATLRFLDKEVVANAFSRAPRDLLQLLLRLLLLAAFVLLMVRPTRTSDEVGPRTLAVILDNSMSMQRKLPDGRTLFDVHQAQIADLFRGMRDQDLFAFLLVGDEVFIDTGFTRDRAALEAALARAEPGDGGGRGLFRAIQRSLTELRNQKALNTAALVFSDQQKSNYAPAAGDAAPGDQMKRGRPGVYLIAEPGEPGPNVAVEDAAFQPARAFLGAGSKATVTLRNYAGAEQATTVSFKEGVTSGESRDVVLRSNEVVRVDLPNIFDSPVDSACEVSLKDDGFDGDNRFRLPMRMRERRQVLLVAPAKYAVKEGTARGYTGADLLALAINPEEALGLPTGMHTALKRVSPEMLERVPLSSYAVIILYGIADLPNAATLNDLATYVRSGGGLCIVPDRELSPVRFNETFAPLLGGFRLGAIRQVEKAGFLDKNEANLRHPLLLPLIREEWGDPDEITCAAYFDLGGTGDAACALSTRDGHWLAAVLRLGRGRVYVQTYSCSILDTSFPRSSVFPPMVQAILAYLADDTAVSERDVIRAGAVHYLDLPLLKGLGGKAVLDGPARFEFPMTESGSDVRVHGLYRAGSYRVTHPLKKTDRVRWLAVNGDPNESDPVPLSDDERQAVFGARNVAQLPYHQLAGQFARRVEVGTRLFYLLFVFLAIEALAGAWQSRHKESAAQ
jgi:hypothetical protein